MAKVAGPRTANEKRFLKEKAGCPGKQGRPTKPAPRSSYRAAGLAWRRWAGQTHGGGKGGWCRVGGTLKIPAPFTDSPHTVCQTLCSVAGKWIRHGFALEAHRVSQKRRINSQKSQHDVIGRDKEAVLQEPLDGESTQKGLLGEGVLNQGDEDTRGCRKGRGELWINHPFLLSCLLWVRIPGDEEEHQDKVRAPGLEALLRPTRAWLLPVLTGTCSSSWSCAGSQQERPPVLLEPRSFPHLGSWKTCGGLFLGRHAVWGLLCTPAEGPWGDGKLQVQVGGGDAVGYQGFTGPFFSFETLLYHVILVNSPGQRPAHEKQRFTFKQLNSILGLSR